MSSLEQNSYEGTWFLSQIVAVTNLLLLSILKLTSPICQYILDAYNMSLGITKSTKL